MHELGGRLSWELGAMGLAGAMIGYELGFAWCHRRRLGPQKLVGSGVGWEPEFAGVPWEPAHRRRLVLWCAWSLGLQEPVRAQGSGSCLGPLEPASSMVGKGPGFVTACSEPGALEAVQGYVSYLVLQELSLCWDVQMLGSTVKLYTHFTLLSQGGIPLHAGLPVFEGRWWG